MDKKYKVDEALNAMVDLLSRNSAVARIFLFGSRVHRDCDELSDYDLLVVIPDEKYYRGISVDIRRSLKSVPVAKDLVVARHSTVNRQSAVPGTIYYEAISDGVQLYATA